jgi:hypothetical protein
MSAGEGESPLAPLPALLAAHGGRDAAWHRSVWRLDARLADIARTTTEPLIGQMRMTWWHEVVSDGTGSKGRGDPLVGVLRARMARDGGRVRAALLAMIDGWEAFVLVRDELDDDALRAFAEGRGGGLFRALAPDGGGEGWLADAGSVWALWDLSGHVSDAAVAERAVALAVALNPPRTGRWSGTTPLRIAYRLACGDVLAGRRAPATLTPGLYARFMRIALFGR